MGQKNHFDVIVIGSGPGGEGAAMGLTKGGKKCRYHRKREQCRRRLYSLGHHPIESPTSRGKPHY